MLFPGLVLVGWTFLPTAHAGGYATARFGGEHGHPATDHPTAIYFNPAGLALGAGTRLYIEGLFIRRTASYERPVEAIDNLGTGTPDDPEAIRANTGKGTLANFLVSPFLGAVTDLGIDNLGVGFGFYVPFGGQASWDTIDEFANNTDYPGAYDGPQRWSTIEGEQRALFATLGGAYRLPGPRLSVGIGLNVVVQQLSVLRARNANGTDDLVSPIGISEGRTLIEGSDTGISVGAGVIWDASDALRVGLSYQSAPGFGSESRLEGTLTTQLGASAPGVTDTVLLSRLPDILRFGVTYRLSPRVELRASGDYQRWSVFEHHCLLSLDDPYARCAIAEDGSVDLERGGSGVLVVIPRDWQDTFGLRAGGSYWFSPVLEAFGGLSFDSNAVPDETLDVGLMDMNKMVASVGARYALLDGALQLTGSLTSVFYFSRDVAPRAADDIPELPSRTPDGAGTYQQNANLLTVGVGYTF